jgi:arginine decarboxylase
MLEVIRRPRGSGRIDMLKLLHFHIGSQLTDIKRIKNAMKEAARVYAKVYQMKVPVDLLDVGGGMAVDYDGSRPRLIPPQLHCRRNSQTTLSIPSNKFATTRNVPHPTIIQESGRFLAAYHAILITNVQDEIETVVEDITPIEIDDDDPQVVTELGDLRSSITVKNYREYYHDALEHREELFTLFNLGWYHLRIARRAKFCSGTSANARISMRSKPSMSQRSLTIFAGLLCAKVFDQFFRCSAQFPTTGPSISFSLSCQFTT